MAYWKFLIHIDIIFIYCTSFFCEMTTFEKLYEVLFEFHAEQAWYPVLVEFKIKLADQIFSKGSQYQKSKRWDRRFESHSRHGCLCAFILCLCCPVCRQRPCDGLITRPKSPAVCVIRLRNWRRGQGPTNVCRAIDEWLNEHLEQIREGCGYLMCYWILKIPIMITNLAA
jgi:hypothetical protein